jgi:molybdenum cofactor guanylyltransferase
MRTRRKWRVESRKAAGFPRLDTLNPRPSTLDLQFSAVVLAGGKSSRMGCDKAWLEVGGQQLLARQIERVREAGAEEVFISGRADTDYAGFGVRVLHDEFAEVGPLAGIERALRAAQTRLLLVLAVDLAGMSVELLRRLAATCSPNVGVVPRVNGNLEPLAAFYPKSALALAGAQLAGSNYAVKDLAARCGKYGRIRFIELAASDAPNFANWNSPADMMPVAE